MRVPGPSRCPSRVRPHAKSFEMRWKLTVAALLATVSFSLAFSGTAFAQEAAEHVARGRDAEASLELVRAAEAYRAAIASEPTSRAAHVARRRLAWMEERAEGDYAPLEGLERARREERVDRAAFERTIDTMPAGRVRRESLELLADAYASTGNTESAETALRRWLAEPGLSNDERDRATALLARLVAPEQPEEAERLLESADLGDSMAAREIDFDRQVRIARPLAFFVLGVAALLLVVAAGARWASPSNLRAVARPGTIVLALWLAGAPLVVAVRYDPSTQDTFVRLALAVLGLFVIAQLVARSLRGATRWRRAVAALAVLMAHGAVGYLVLLASGATLGILGP